MLCPQSEAGPWMDANNTARRCIRGRDNGYSLSGPIRDGRSKMNEYDCCRKFFGYRPRNRHWLPRSVSPQSVQSTIVCPDRNWHRRAANLASDEARNQIVHPIFVLPGENHGTYEPGHAFRINCVAARTTPVSVHTHDAHNEKLVILSMSPGTAVRRDNHGEHSTSGNFLQCQLSETRKSSQFSSPSLSTYRALESSAAQALTRTFRIRPGMTKIRRFCFTNMKK